MKSSIELMVGKDKVKFIIVERKPDGISDNKREEEISLKLAEPVSFFPEEEISLKLAEPVSFFPEEEPADYVETIMYHIRGPIWIGFNFRRWPEKSSGLEECLDGPFVLPSQFHPSQEEEALAEKREGSFVLSKKLY